MKDLLDNPPPGPKTAEAVAPPSSLDSFNPDHENYQAYARPSPHQVPSVNFISRDLSVRTCFYAHLDTDHPGGCQFIPSALGKGNVLKLQFAGARAVIEVTLEGRKLWHLYEYLVQERMLWVYELPEARDFEEDDKPVVHSIKFRNLTETAPPPLHNPGPVPRLGGDKDERSVVV